MMDMALDGIALAPSAEAAANMRAALAEDRSPAAAAAAGPTSQQQRTAADADAAMAALLVGAQTTAYCCLSIQAHGTAVCAVLHCAWCMSLRTIICMHGASAQSSPSCNLTPRMLHPQLAVCQPSSCSKRLNAAVCLTVFD